MICQHFSGEHGFDNSMVVVITNGDYGTNWLRTQRPYVRYCDFTVALPDTVSTNEHVWAEFGCHFNKRIDEKAPLWPGSPRFIFSY